MHLSDNFLSKTPQRGSAFILLIVGAVVAFSIFIVSGASDFQYSSPQLVENPSGSPGSGINPPNPVSHFMNVELSYNENSTNSITINNVTAHETTVTPLNTAKIERTNELFSEYSLEYLDSGGNVLFEKKFDVPKTLITDAGYFGATGPSTIEFSNLNFALSLPVIENASSLRVTDERGGIITSRTLPSEVTSLPPPPSFQTSSATPVTIAFLSAGYTENEMGTFASDVQRVKSTLTTVAPYNELSGSINFIEVRNTSDLSCQLTGDRYITCDLDKVAQALANAGVAIDTVLVILNEPTRYAGTAYIGGGVGFQTNHELLGIVATHELQHALIGLYDEYVYPGESGERQGGGDLKNCYAGQPPAQNWKGVVSDNSYFQGCNNATNWYRSSEDSLMKSNTPYLNPISIKYVKERFGIYTGDNQTDSPTPTNTPKPNATATPTLTPTPKLAEPGVGWCANDTRGNAKSVKGGSCNIDTANWVGTGTNPYCVEHYPGASEYFYLCNDQESDNQTTPTPPADNPVCTGPSTGPCKGCMNGVLGYLNPRCGEGESGDYSTSRGGTYCGKNYYDVYLCNNGEKDAFPVPQNNSTCNSIPWCINQGSPTPPLGSGQPTATPVYSLECPSDGYHICASSTSCDGQPGYSPKPSGNQACAEHFAGTLESDKVICCQKPK